MQCHNLFRLSSYSKDSSDRTESSGGVAWHSQHMLICLICLTDQQDERPSGIGSEMASLDMMVGVHAILSPQTD